ncbi:MAG: immunoglobulin domain-containing protein, partial [Limisphaerales bacterium]
NGTNIIGATNASLVFTNVQLSDAGSYSVIASNFVTNATSSSGVVTVASTPPTSLLIYDPIPYEPGTNIAGQGQWFGLTNTFKATNGNLMVAGLAPSQGNMITWAQTPGASIRLTNGPITATGSIYFSFAYRVDALANTVGSTVAAFVPNFTAATYAPKINVRLDSGGVGYNIGVFKGTGETTGSYATNIFALGETVFIVARYTFGDSGTTTSLDDTCTLWLNPAPSSFGLTNPPAATVGEFGLGATDLAQIVGFALRTVGGPTLSYADEIRVGLTWGDVTPPAGSTGAPTLTITRSGTNVVITWPTTFTGFTLEGTPSLSPPIIWTTIPSAVNGTNNTATVNASSGNQFFRLRK